HRWQALGTFRTARILPERRDVRRRRDGDVPVPDGLYGYGGDHRHGRRGRAMEVCRLRGLKHVPRRHYLSALWQLGMGRRLALAAWRQLPYRPRLLRLRGFGRGACGRRGERAGGLDDHWTA